MRELSDEMKALDRLRRVAEDAMFRTGVYSSDRARGGNITKKELDAHRKMLLSQAKLMVEDATFFYKELLRDPDFKPIADQQ